MVIAAAGCDNVEWGGLDVAVVSPPPKTAPVSGDVDEGESLPEGPILYHVLRDSVRATMVPVGVVQGQALVPIRHGDDTAAFGDRFITSFLRADAEFTLFRHGRRAGTLIVDSAYVPTIGACRPLPIARGDLELADAAGDAAEFLAMARTQAPEGRSLAGVSMEPERRMRVVGPILAERILRARDIPLPNWGRALQQIQPFPIAESRDLAFTATFLSSDVLETGYDDQGYALFIVYTPQAQIGYDTAYVDFASYTASGKAAPRVVDFLDWDRDGHPELLLQVFGTRQAWYRALEQEGGDWQQTFEDRCDPALAPPLPDTAAADTAATDSAGPAPTPAAGGAASPTTEPARPDTTPRPPPDTSGPPAGSAAGT
ncbi:MAG: hypothetical protein P8177_09220, partial [Gemmatimonadota bacterium]